MFKIITVILALILLTGCATTPYTATPFVSVEQQRQMVQDAFDKQKTANEDEARAGRITWGDAAQLTRLLDKQFAESLRSKGRSDLWVFDSNDEEYHAYCIALAEQLDKKKISFAEYDAARTKRFNEIQLRRQTLANQAQIISNTQPRSSNCVTTNTGTEIFPRYVTRCQ